MVQTFENGAKIKAYFLGEEKPLVFENVTQMSKEEIGFVVLIIDGEANLLNFQTLKYITIEHNKAK